MLEVNPRASRTVPFVAKATGVPIAKIAARVMAGEKLANFQLEAKARRPHVAVKEAVFPFARFPGVDLILGPEMKSTGEVMGLDSDFGRAFAKSQLGSGVDLPLEGRGLHLGARPGQGGLVEPCRRLVEMGFELVATDGTAEFLRQAGLDGRRGQQGAGGPARISSTDASGEVQLVFNTTEGAQAIADSFSLRRTALTNRSPITRPLRAPGPRSRRSRALRDRQLEVAPLQSYF